ncbi:hypothetical protein F5Y16DRAFT_396504 [Xylariaceae sp. FL0255]|nr:hypothetical protein F5Y16DRAFT_396504 [Xylariaceae sp. FL0255]
MEHAKHPFSMAKCLKSPSQHSSRASSKDGKNVRPNGQVSTLFVLKKGIGLNRKADVASAMRTDNTCYTQEILTARKSDVCSTQEKPVASKSDVAQSSGLRIKQGGSKYGGKVFMSGKATAHQGNKIMGDTQGDIEQERSEFNANVEAKDEADVSQGNQINGKATGR